LSYKDNILDTKYQSWLEPLEKPLPAPIQAEKDKKAKKEELISDLEIRLRKSYFFMCNINKIFNRLQEELHLKKAKEFFPKNSSFLDSNGLKTMEKYFFSL